MNGHVRGFMNGFVDAEIHGLIRGNMDAVVNIDNISRETEGNSDEKYSLEAANSDSDSDEE